MSAKSFQPHLDNLLHISHVVGCNERFVQAGGGNTSVKLPDSKTMLIKASGTPLARMTSERGWVAVDLSITRGLFTRPDLRELDDAEREKQVLTTLGDAVVEPPEARPSVETPLHALLDTVVMHAHPVAAIALSGRPDADQVLSRLCEGVSERPPLWLPYIDPGTTLAFAVADRIESYAAEHGGPPDVIAQQNHGLFVAAPSATACVIKFHEIVERIENALLAELPSGIAPQAAAAVGAAVRRAYGEGAVVRCSRRPELIMAARDPYVQMFASALSPDHVVYTGPCAVSIDQSTAEHDIDAAIETYRSKHGILPKLIVVEDATVCIAAESEKKAAAAEVLAVAAVEAAVLSNNALRFLTPKDVAFIMNWEAEHYRAKQ